MHRMDRRLAGCAGRKTGRQAGRTDSKGWTGVTIHYYLGMVAAAA